MDQNISCGKVSQPMQQYLRLDLDDLLSECIYSDYDLSGASHYQIVKVEDKEKFLRTTVLGAIINHANS